MVKIEKKDILIIMLFLLLCIVFFYKTLFIDKIRLFNGDAQVDFLTQFYSATLLSEGIKPLWDPYHFGHFIAYYTSAVFYPINIMMRLFFNPQNIYLSFRIFEYFLIFHYFLSSVFMYLLMRTLNASRPASFLGAFTFSFGGFMVSHMIHVPLIYASCWAPLLFLLIIKSLKNNARLIIFAGIVLGIMFFTGHPQPTIYYIYYILIFCIYQAYILYKQGHGLLTSFKPIVLFLVCVIIAVGVSAVQIFPCIELIPYSLRSATSYEQMYSQGSISPAHLITFLMPDFFGGTQIGYWGVDFESIGIQETNYYLGIHSIILIFLLLLLRTSKKERRGQHLLFFFLSSLAFLILMLGNNTILSAWHFYLPGLSKVRIASRISSVLNFTMAILAGFGLDVILSDPKKILDFFKKSKRIFLNLQLIFISWIGILLFNYAQAQQTIEIQERISNSCFSFIRFFIIFNLLIISIWVLVKKTNTFRKIGFVCLFFIILFDIFTFQMDFSPRSSISDNPLLAVKNKDVSILLNLKSPEIPLPIREDKSLYRIRMADLHDPQRYTFTNKLFGLGYVGTSGVARLTSFREKFEETEPPYTFKNPSSKLIDFYNVKYLYSELDLTRISDKYIPLSGYPNWFSNVNYFERVYCLQNYLLIENDSLILEEIDTIDLSRYIILSQEPTINSLTNKGNQKSICYVTNYSNNEINIRAEMKEDGFVVISDPWYPGWKAYVDNQPTKIYRANYVFRAVEVPKGTHSIKFRYAPFSMAIGLITSIVTLGGIVILMFVKRIKK